MHHLLCKNFYHRFRYFFTFTQTQSFIASQRDDPVFPHTHVTDFKFTVFFPEEFRSLWKSFGVTAEKLLESLTYWNLDGFDNPAKGGSKFFISWDAKYFLKSVLMKPKHLLNKDEKGGALLTAFDDWLCKQVGNG